MANDPWFRGLELKYGPDGGVYLTDWSDTGECHETDADSAHRENGRIYKITYGTAKPVQVDLAGVDRRGAGPAPAPQERLVRPHGPAPPPGAGRRGGRPRQGPPGAASDPRDPVPTRPGACGPSGPCTPPAAWIDRP